MANFFTNVPWSRIAFNTAGIIMALAAAWYYVHDTPPQRAESERMWMQTDARKVEAEQLTKQMEIARKAGRNVPVPALHGTIGPATTVTSHVVTLDSMPCDTEEEQRVWLASGKVQVIENTGTQYRFPRGCAFVRMDAPARSLNATGRYLLQAKNSKPEEAEFLECGTIRGSDSYSECTLYANGRLGAVMRVISTDVLSIVTN